MALPKLEGRITIDTAWVWAIVEQPGSVSKSVTVLPAGDYYLTSSTALLSTISTALTADATLGGTYSFVLDDTSDTATGKVTLSATGIASFAFTYSSGSPGPLATIGLAEGTTAEEHTGTNQSPYLFLPNCGRANIASPDGNAGYQESDLTVVYAPDGTSKRLAYNTGASTRFCDNLEFTNLKGSKTWISYETVTNESLQKFWQTVMSAGKPFRYYPSRDTDSTHVSWIAEAANFQPAAFDPSWWNANALYQWSTRVGKLV